MTRRTVASLQSDVSTGQLAGTIDHKYFKDLTDSFYDLDTKEADAALAAAGTGPTRLGVEQILWRITAADMNVTTDQAFTKVGTFANYLITAIRAANGSVNLTTAQGGIYNTASKGGTALVANTQAYTALDAATKGVDLTLVAIAKGVRSDAGLFLALTNAQGGAGTADFYVFGIPLTAA